jgi:hypothetical protein
VVDPLVDQLFGLDGGGRMRGGEGHRRRVACAGGPCVDEDVVQRAQDGAVWGGVEVAGHNDRQRTIQGRVGGQVDQGVCLGDAVVVVGRLILQARGDDMQGAGGVCQGRDHGDRVQRTVPRWELDLSPTGDRPATQQPEAERYSFVVWGPRRFRCRRI